MSLYEASGLKRIIKAFGYSWDGLVASFRSEPAFRQELLLILLVAPIPFIYHVPLLETLLMIGSLFLMLIAELVNTAIEAVVDRISLDHHPLSKKAKDVGSALVLVACANALFIWVMVLWVS